jgi:hypothetical protein
MLLALLSNIELTQKIANYKHSSLFGLMITDKEIFYNAGTVATVFESCS